MAFGDNKDKRFSTASKTTININRKHSIVKEKCNQLMKMMWDLGYRNKIPHGDLRYLICEYIGGDRGTVRAYLGFRGRVQHNIFGSKVIGIMREGYLQIFGYAERKNAKAWILSHKNVPLPYHYKEELIPPVPPLPNNDERLRKVKMEKISLSQRGSNYTENSSLTNGEGGVVRNRINNNNTERERNFPNGIQNCIRKELTKLEQAILTAKPSEKGEPDRAKIRWNSDE